MEDESNHGPESLLLTLAYLSVIDVVFGLARAFVTERGLNPRKSIWKSTVY